MVRYICIQVGHTRGVIRKLSGWALTKVGHGNKY